MMTNLVPWQNLQSTPAAPDSRRTADRLTSSAQQFESMLLGQYLADAESSFGSAPGGSDDQDSGGEQMKDFGIRQLAGELTAQGGIGLARMVKEGLLKAADHVTDADASSSISKREVGAKVSAYAEFAYKAEAPR